MHTYSFPVVLRLSTALTIYLTSLFAANTLGIKLMPFIFDTTLSVSVFSFPVVFLMTDIIGELYGKKTAQLFVRAGVISVALFTLYSVLSIILPWSARAEWVHDAYNQIFGVSIRIAIASLAAFAIAEYQDVYSFFLLKERWGTRMLWLRSLLSNVWSQFIDTVIFMVIAFAGVYETNTLIHIIISWWIFKVVMGFFYSPLLYVGMKLFAPPQETHTH